MGKLIDAERLLAKVVEANPMGGMIGGKFIEDLIKAEPTAYDVDKVVEQIEKISVYRSEYSEIVDCNIEIFGHCRGSCYECILNCVTDIVKGAVKDESSNIST